MAAPVTVIVAYDPRFYDHLPTLFPHNPDAHVLVHQQRFAGRAPRRSATAPCRAPICSWRRGRWGSISGAMSGFDNAKVDEAFLADRGWRSNFLVNLGHGDPAGLFDRSPRLGFAEAAVIE